MSNLVMPETRAYTFDDGVCIEYLTYTTLKAIIVEKLCLEGLGIPGTDKNRNVRSEVYMFYRGMPAIVRVSLPENPPAWGVVLKSVVETSEWLDDPVKDFRQLERFAPAEVILNAYEGYNKTREKALAAPIELTSPLIPVDEFDDTISEEEKQAKKKTSNGAGRSLTKRSSNGRAARSAAPTRPRK